MINFDNQNSLKKIKNILEKESKLIKLENFKKVIFVGDTHGDLDASQKVIKDFLRPGNGIVFLGDYVDRGPQSRENLDYLLAEEQKFPEQVYLLQGNHEGYPILEFSPADFWENLSPSDYEKYSLIVEKMPLALVAEDIVALHGCLPDVKNLKEINEIKLGKEQWQQIVWGDFVTDQGKFLGFDSFTGRPQFGRDWFFEIMEKLNKKVLIRSHQPDTPRFIFNDRCLTIFTSSAYTHERTIAIADFSKKIETARDLEIKNL